MVRADETANATIMRSIAKYSRLGIPKSLLQETLSARQAMIAEHAPIEPDWNQSGVRKHRTTDHCIVGLIHECRGEPDDARVHGVASLEWTHDYFFGTWRRELRDGRGKPRTEASVRREMSWIDPFREGVMWSLCLQDRRLTKLVSYPDIDLLKLLDEGLLDYTPADHSFYLALAMYLCGEPWAESESLRRRVNGSSQKRPKLLVAILESIQAKDSERFEQTMVEHLKHFRRVQFDTMYMVTCQSIDGTSLWYLAEKEGIKLPRLPGELKDLLVTLDS